MLDEKKTDNRLILLNERDNVLVCRDQIYASEVIELDGDNIRVLGSVDLGHKLARKKIAAGEKIIKYGVSIGSAIVDIQRAQHVHLHNIKSDYIPSHTRENDGRKNDRKEGI